MQASDREKTEPPMFRFGFRLGCGRGCGPGKHAIDPKTLHDDFLCERARIVAENVLAVEVGDRHTELASTQLGREQIRALQQIGPV
jgi:hypothetical protein